MATIATAADLHGLDTEITLAPPHWGDLDDLVLPAGRLVFYAPASPKNYFPSAHRSPAYDRAFTAQCLVWHSAEEKPDKVDVTPRYFQDPHAQASTLFYVDSRGNLWQMVKIGDFAWAQGTPAADDRLLHSRPEWMPPPPTSYNVFGVSIEQEFHAEGDVSQAFYEGSPMFDSGARWAAQQHRKLSIPLTPDRWQVHMGLNREKGDPGQYWLSLKPRLFALAQHYYHDEAADPPQLDGDLQAQVAALANRVRTLEADQTVNTDWRLRVQQAMSDAQ